MTNPAPPSEQVAERARVPAARSESRARSQQVAVRLSPDEYADLQRLCAARHLTPGALLRAGLHLFTATETLDA